MNAPIRRVALLIGAMFVLLLLSSTMVQFVQAPAINARADNKRTLLDTFSRERGKILAGNEVIAESVPSKDQYQWQRVYPQGKLYSQITGFYAYNQGNPYGLEYAAADLLSGDSDKLFVRRITDLFTGSPTTGATLELTIDPKVQRVADEALGNSRGAVVALDPKTGAILAMVSHPQYDPNSLATHNIAAADKAWAALTADPNHPFYNRAIAGNLYPPGSTFKIVTATAALDNQIVQDENTVIPGPAILPLPGTASATLPNEDRQPCGPGNQSTLMVALERSCNTSFGGLGIKLGPDKLKEAAAKFGFGDVITLPLRVAPSTMPADMNQAQAAQSAIGQYDVRTTPLQMALVAAGIGNDGVVMKPYLIEQVRHGVDIIQDRPTPTPLTQATSPEHAAIVKKMMVGVVNNGSGARAQISGIQVAGKTGTAQHDPSKPPHAWFIAFAPADNPQIAVAVVVEDGGVSGSEVGGGRIAAPIAKLVMEAVLGQ